MNLKLPWRGVFPPQLICYTPCLWYRATQNLITQRVGVKLTGHIIFPGASVLIDEISHCFRLYPIVIPVQGLIGRWQPGLVWQRYICTPSYPPFTLFEFRIIRLNDAFPKPRMVRFWGTVMDRSSRNIFSFKSFGQQCLWMMSNPPKLLCKL